MVSKDEDKIDFGKLEKELNAAVESDARYWRENDAKFRAVNQKVATYEEFRDIVAAAHIKPLEKGDRLDQVSFTQPWNSQANTDKTATTGPTDDSKQATEKLPSNGHEFAREWRKCGKSCANKYNLLLKLEADRIRSIFKTEISFGLLGEIMTALSKEWQGSDCVAVLTIVEALSQANRFKLTLEFLSIEETAVCKRLFTSVSEYINKLEDQEEQARLQAKLNVLTSRYRVDRA